METAEIYYLESHGHKVLIHCKGQDLTLRMTIPEALEQLPKRCFASPHKSYLVTWSILSMPLERQLFCPVEINCRSVGGSVRSSIRALTLIWEDDILFCEFAGSFANIALLVLFVDRLFQKKDLSSRWYYLYIALLIVGQCTLSLFPTWVCRERFTFCWEGFFWRCCFMKHKYGKPSLQVLHFHACSSS